jgi:hypothetical protein
VIILWAYLPLPLLLCAPAAAVSSSGGGAAFAAADDELPPATQKKTPQAAATGSAKREIIFSVFCKHRSPQRRAKRRLLSATQTHTLPHCGFVCGIWRKDKSSWLMIAACAFKPSLNSNNGPLCVWARELKSGLHLWRTHTLNYLLVQQHELGQRAVFVGAYQFNDVGKNQTIKSGTKMWLS